MDVAELGYRIKSDELIRGRQRVRDLAKESERTAAVAGKTSAAVSASFRKIGASIAVATGGLFALGGAFNTIRQFDSAMSQVGAVSRATASDLSDMRDIAKELGSTTEFTATQAAEGLRFLSMAGFEAKESIAAIPAVLDLATAASLDLGNAADIASNIMSAFSISAADSASVADILAAASSRSNTNVQQLGTAMSFVGPIAAAMGVEMEKAAAAIGILSDNGLQGSMAGTGLRRVMSSLANATPEAAAVIKQLGLNLEDLNPATTELVDIVDQFAEVSLSAADALTIFGDRGGPAILALVNNNGRLRELTKIMSNVDGEAERMAGTMRDNLGGEVNTMISALQGLAIAIGEAGLTSAIRGLISAVSSLARGLTSAVQGLSSMAAAVSDFLNPLDAAGQAQMALQVSIDNTSIAVGDYINASRDLAQQIKLGSLATIGEVRAQLQSAKARRDQIELIRQENIERAKSSEFFQNNILKIQSLRDALNSLAAPGTDLEQISARQREGYEAISLELVEALNAQKQFLASLQEGVALTDEQASALSDVEANIKELESLMQSYNAEGDYANEWSERLESVWIGISGGTETSNKAMGILGQTIVGVTRSAGALLSVIQRMVSLLPSVGTGIGGIASQIAGSVSAVGSNIAGSNALSGLSQQLGTIGGVLSATFQSAVNRANAPGFGSSGGSGGGGSDVQEGLREAQNLFQSTRTEAEKYAAEIERINELHREFPQIVTEEVRDRALVKLQEEFEKTSESTKGYASTIKSAFSDMIDEFVETGKIGEEAILSLANSIAKLALEAAVFKSLAGIFPSLFGAGGSVPLVNADGNAFSGGNVIPFARGGVVSRPTLFPMAKGTGLMGEAGPEAVMPLKRGKNGRLGVESQGVNTNLEVNIYGAPSSPEVSREGNRVDIDFRKATNEMVSNGQLDRSMNSRYGLKPKSQGA